MMFKPSNDNDPQTCEDKAIILNTHIYYHRITIKSIVNFVNKHFIFFLLLSSKKAIYYKALEH